jgi:peptide chain release factor 1
VLERLQGLERLQDLEGEYDAVEAQLADPAVLADPNQLRDASRRHKQLTPLVTAYRRYIARQADRDAAHELLAEATGDERELLRAEAHAAEEELEQLQEELKELLIPADPNDGKNVIVEIRGAEGGEEANLFARDLFQMYQAYATRMGWPVEVLSTDLSDLGGINQVTFLVKGDTAWTHLKFEGGPHRVQRVPVTESSGRIHTSSATVLVLPEAEEVDVEIDPNDLQIDVYRSSGPGGQGVNTTDSAVRITHKPTGLTVAMQDERSQLQNRARAMTVLRARLLKAKQDEQAAALSAERRSQVGGGGRSEKIRTYNFKENRVSDHRIGLTLYRLQQVLAGELDEVVEALMADERARQLAAAET